MVVCSVCFSDAVKAKNFRPRPILASTLNAKAIGPEANAKAYVYTEIEIRSTYNDITRQVMNSMLIAFA